MSNLFCRTFLFIDNILLFTVFQFFFVMPVHFIVFHERQKCLVFQLYHGMVRNIILIPLCVW